MTLSPDPSPIKGFSLSLDMKPLALELAKDSPDSDDIQEKDAKESLPKRLRAMITENSDSPVIQALNGIDISGINPKRIEDTLIRLKVYLNKCIDEGLILESALVDTTIKTVKENFRQVKQMLGPEIIDKLEDQLDGVIAEIEQQQILFSNSKSILEIKMDISMKSLDIKLNEDIEAIGAEWNSPKRIQQFSKPPPKIHELRREAQRLLSAKRFQEAADLSSDISRMEQLESKASSERLKESYEHAISKRKQKYVSDVTSVRATYETKLNSLIAENEKKLLPLYRRKSKIESQLKNALETDKRIKTTIERSQRSSVTPDFKFKHSTIRKTNQLQVSFTPKTKTPLIRKKNNDL